MSYLRRLYCLLFDHNFVFRENLSQRSSRFTCTKCGSDIAHNRDCGITIPYTPEVQQFYSEFNDLVGRK